MSAVETRVPAATRRPVGVGQLSLVELRRFVARSAVRWLLVGMLAVVGVMAYGAYSDTRPPTRAQLDSAQQALDEQLVYWEDGGGEQQIQDCLDAEAAERERDPDAMVDFGCDQITPPQLDWFLPHRTTFAESAASWMSQVVTFGLMAALIIGATFVAAEFATGSLSTWLTFEPRRGRVFASKTAVAGVAAGVATLVQAALTVGATWVASGLNDAHGEVTAELWTQLAHGALRAGGMGLAAAVIGAALAFLLRHTAAAIAVVFAWLAILETLLRVNVEWFARWSVYLNMEAWLRGGLEEPIGPGSCTTDSSGVTSCDSEMLIITMTQAGWYLLALVAVILVAAVLVFRRRDVS